MKRIHAHDKRIIDIFWIECHQHSIDEFHWDEAN